MYTPLNQFKSVLGKVICLDLHGVVRKILHGQHCKEFVSNLVFFCGAVIDIIPKGYEDITK